MAGASESDESNYLPAIVAGVACLVYAATLGNELVFDDAELIPAHEALSRPFDLVAIFTGRYWGNIHELDTLYRPIVIWSLALNAEFNRLLGLSSSAPALYHAVNIALHAGVSVLLLRFSLRMKLLPAGALAAGLVFAVHPIHTEAVASIVNRSELLAAFFGLTFVLLHLEGKRPRAALGCLMIALFSKESALAWVPVAALIDLLLGHQSWKRYPIYLAGVIGWLGLRAIAIAGTWQDVPYIDNPLVQASMGERLLTAARVQVDYIQLQILPIGLSSDYSAHQIPIAKSILEPRVMAFSMLAIFLVTAAWRLRERQPVFLIALGGYALLHGPTANILFPIGTTMGERLVYAPSLFSCLLVGMGCQRIRGAATYAGLLVVALLAGASIHRNLEWATPERFYSAQVRSAPHSAKAHYALARSVYYPAGDIESAKRHYIRSIEIYSGFAGAWNNLGAAYLELGDLARAVDAYQRTIALEPYHAEANANLGGLLQQKGDLDGAYRAYERALEANPEQPQTLNNMAMIYITRHQPEKARPLLLEALRLAPDYALARENLRRLEH